MRYLLAVAVACGVVACHARGSADTGRTNGTFAYRIIMGLRDPIEGTFTIAPDTVTVDSEWFCRQAFELNVSQRSRRFTCNPPAGLDAFSLSIDAFSPGLSSWYASKTVNRTRQVCAQYTLTARGARVCVRYETEVYQVDSTFGGRLRIMSKGG